MFVCVFEHGRQSKPKKIHDLEGQLKESKSSPKQSETGYTIRNKKFMYRGKKCRLCRLAKFHSHANENREERNFWGYKKFEM